MASGNSRLYIYDRKEIFILILLGVMVALFSFTLGIHLGKSVKHADVTSPPHDPTAVAVVNDKIPERAEFAEQERQIKDAADEAMYEELHKEVGKTGVKLTPGRQVDLPDETISANPPVASPASNSARDDSVPALQRQAPRGKFTLQVGSFPTLTEAKNRSDALDAAGLRPFVRLADLSEKGKWYRVYIGGYETMDGAQKAGHRHKQARAIDSFLVAKMPE